MAAAYLLTLLGVSGAAAGLLLGKKRQFSAYLGAAGGGLLFGIAVFWILPEIASELNWLLAFFLAAGAYFGITLLDRFFESADPLPAQEVIGPLLAAAAVHSFLDGWSLRAVSNQQVANVVVPLGLALHKIPEGLALGWITGRSFTSPWKALTACAFAEAATIAGALIEPRVDQSATREFGAWWMAVVLAIIAGSFFFLGVHAVLPARRKVGVLAVFLATSLSIGGVTLFRS